MTDPDASTQGKLYIAFFPDFVDPTLLLRGDEDGLRELEALFRELG